MSALDAFRSVDFDWTRQLRSIWRDAPYNVPSLHKDRLDDLVDYFERKTRDPDPPDEPLGKVIVGPAGYGKTHLVGQLRRRVWDLDGWFVLLDFVGIRDFWASVALGFLNSLQVRMHDGKMQYDHLVLRIASQLGIHQELLDIANRCRDRPRDLVTELAGLFVRSLSRLHLQETGRHRDVVTALILLISEDLDCHSVAHAWLQGVNLEGETVKPLGFVGENNPIKVVQGLSWIMSLVGPTLIAIDQIDAIVSASNTLVRGTNGGAKEEQKEAQSIVESLALGLMELHDEKRRSVTVISCLEATWKVLQDRATVAVTDRYNIPANLRALPTRDIAEGLVAARLQPAYAAHDFKPPYPTWPFAPVAFETAIDYSPRQLLKACQAHREFCIAQAKVTECIMFGASVPRPDTPRTEPDSLNHAFEGELELASPVGLMDAEGEDRLYELLDATLRLFEKHLDLPDDIDVGVQRDPDQRRPSLHGRLSFTFHAEGDREQHYCFRILGHTNAIAFQARLKAAMTASGIDTALKFRHLFILRRREVPGGPRTKALVAQFMKAGGKFIAPTDDDLRAFVALRAMAGRDPPGFEVWLRDRKPLFDTSLFKAAGLCPPPFLPSLSPTPPGVRLRKAGAATTENALAGETDNEPADKRAKPLTDRTKSAAQQKERAPAASAPGPRAAEPPATPRLLPIGRRFERGELGNPVTLAADLLPRHFAILAGSGSGKTVLLRRIVEEAALLGIPAIVLDINNDLSRLGDPWPARPDGFGDEDAAKAATYHARTDVVVWTPGISSGNPVSPNLLPDFAAIGNKQDSQTEDERAQAVEMARATLAPYLGGTGQKALLKQGVLADALRAFAKSGGALHDLIGLLADLPENISRIGDAPKLAGEIANQLLAAIATNPLLQSAGSSLDPQQLFNGRDGKTRISVINLAGLASDEARQSFVNQLQMTLFTWIKQNPSPTGRLYVLDEAQNFAPSQVGTACKASALSLVAQARKYGLGMIFATQLPKGIDNAIVSNCTTHVYGRMSSPATIQATQELMAAKGGAAEDIARLTRGEFYFSTDGFNRPLKVRTPLCLSWHPPNPPTADEVVLKGHSSRE
jgi:DNA helicase HerA-like ATPase